MNAQPAVLGSRSRRTPRTVRTAEGRAAPRYVLTAAAPSVMSLLAKEAMAVVKYFRLPLQLAPLIRHSEGRTLRSGAQFPLLSRIQIRRSLYHGVQKDRISNAVDEMVGKEEMWL